jgi:protein-disulfide isomerase
VKTTTKINLLVAFIFVVIFGVVAVIYMGSLGNAAAEAGRTPIVREDSHHLTVAENEKVTVVEFLDFECESCAAVYPTVEELRERYGDQVTFVVRYFPIPSHKNAENAALAVEAAAQQGQFEAMYSRMYETQPQWGEQQESQASLFRSYAEQLGLDMTAYDADIAHPDTRQRVQQDMDDGLALGVSGTPTFFINDEKLDLTTIDDIEQAIQAALAE